jgi:S-phase kinase-associated protein 1
VLLVHVPETNFPFSFLSFCLHFITEYFTMATEEGTTTDTTGRQVNLISSEGESFNMPLEHASMSELVKTMYDEDGDAEEAQDIPLPNITTAILAKVVEFIRHHITDPLTGIQKPLKSPSLTDMVQEWYSAFIDIEQETVFEIMLAANFMDIKPLLDLTCAAIALKIKGKTPEEIRKTFNITEEWTAEDEAKMREENKWCEEI